MLMRCLTLVALGVALPVGGHTQGELSQCNSSDRAQIYPCRKSGGVIRSKRDHVLQEKSLKSTGKLLDQSVLDRGRDKDNLVRDLLDLLLDN